MEPQQTTRAHVHVLFTTEAISNQCVGAETEDVTS